MKRKSHPDLMLTIHQLQLHLNPVHLNPLLILTSRVHPMSLNVKLKTVKMLNRNQKNFILFYKEVNLIFLYLYCVNGRSYALL